MHHLVGLSPIASAIRLCFFKIRKDLARDFPRAGIAQRLGPRVVGRANEAFISLNGNRRQDGIAIAICDIRRIYACRGGVYHAIIFHAHASLSLAFQKPTCIIGEFLL